jgi:hypothetical protein
MAVEAAFPQSHNAKFLGADFKAHYRLDSAKKTHESNAHASVRNWVTHIEALRCPLLRTICPTEHCKKLMAEGGATRTAMSTFVVAFGSEARHIFSAL